ncbi:MAG: sulfur reduction protein DsrS [Gammaproteobacteria bacterium]|nr:sulfur reduction protein DsrS [Gammaproteobacteria bacterium]
MLSDQDSLRLNVLLANSVKAIRIDESRMEVFGLTDEGEVKVPLNPNSRHEQYLKRVREMISGHVMGSPGGYPVFLQRWTRMGQARNENLAELLMLGEPEAVVAVVHAPGLTPELAERAWWAMPDAENARRMLENPDVASSELGKELATFLIEYLPFETEPNHIIDSVRLVLQPGLISEDQKQKIWLRGARKNIFYLGFLLAIPDDLPEQGNARSDFEMYSPILSDLVKEGNQFAGMLLRILDAPGQSFLQTVATVLRKPSHQEVVVSLFNAIGQYCAPFLVTDMVSPDIDEMCQRADQCCQGNIVLSGSLAEEMRALFDSVPALHLEISALLVLAGMSEAQLGDIFARTTAIGTLMRRKIEPITTPLSNQLSVLLGIKS